MNTHICNSGLFSYVLRTSNFFNNVFLLMVSELHCQKMIRILHNLFAFLFLDTSPRPAWVGVALMLPAFGISAIWLHRIVLMSQIFFLLPMPCFCCSSNLHSYMSHGDPFTSFVTFFCRVFCLAFFKGINLTHFCMVLLTMERRYAGMKNFILR